MKKTKEKLTKQGVRDLNTKQRNGRATQECDHLAGPQESLGNKLEYDPDLGHEVMVESIGARCLYCKAVLHSY